jgi:dihydroxyacetone kinase-like protein
MTAKPSQQRKSGAGKATVSETFDTMPLRYGDDPYVWACWLYYEDGMTQGDIADAMGISRATVNSYLADARERGIVNISIEPARLASLTVAQELKRHFGLVDCLVVPSDDSARPLIDRLGVAGAQALQTAFEIRRYTCRRPGAAQCLRSASGHLRRACRT